MLPPEIASSFYHAMSNRDAATMNRCYATDATFSDPIFPNLASDQVQAMWSMLMAGAKDFTVQHRIEHADARTVNVHWLATYTFSQTGRHVVNEVVTEMKFKDGKIIQQRDHFNFHRWARQALGLPGLLFGWTSWFQNALQNKSREKLEKFQKIQAAAHN